MWKIIINSHYFTIVYPVLLIFSVIIGAKIARRTWITKKIEWKASGVDASVIAIYSLLLSFTFFASNNLMRDRLVILNNMRDGSASLQRTSLMTSDSLQTETKIFLSSFLYLMSDFKTHYLSSEAATRKNMETINNRYLHALSSEAKKDAAGQAAVLSLMPFLNQINGTFYRFVDSYDYRTPPLILILLIFSSLLIGVLVGFLNSFNNKTHYLVPVIFVVIVALCIQCIRDLDNPYIGSIQPDFSDFSYQLKMLKEANP